MHGWQPLDIRQGKLNQWLSWLIQAKFKVSGHLYMLENRVGTWRVPSKVNSTRNILLLPTMADWNLLIQANGAHTVKVDHSTKPTFHQHLIQQMKSGGNKIWEQRTFSI